MPLPTYLLLSLADASPAADGPPRCLNSAGRWAVQGFASLPLLVWPAAEAAQAAAERASAARGARVDVVARTEAGWTEGREIVAFTELHEPALLGASVHSAAKARRLRTEAEKLEAFCVIVRAASTAADQASFAEVGRAAAKALRARFGGGSITSAFAWVAGPAGQETLKSLLTGEVEASGPLSIAQLAEAVALAQKAECLREQAG
ncbi:MULTISPECIES: hypothetical protein [unclassified Variovorax]|uniref:hypothetical protein n=1 Tax=unclassified Variovorax TaxID=663243 RepID=UPI00257632E4|nr:MULTISPECIES: hypothetical protein [unclassified Variovorax]MDM0090103.1 hypothetical protein [Variovorax sp. J22G40]MDM0148231.1 hypothetical protein [Variovorax sp. J2P1-31]